MSKVPYTIQNIMTFSLFHFKLKEVSSIFIFLCRSSLYLSLNILGFIKKNCICLDAVNDSKKITIYLHKILKFFCLVILFKIQKYLYEMVNIHYSQRSSKSICILKLKSKVYWSLKKWFKFAWNRFKNFNKGSISCVKICH